MNPNHTKSQTDRKGTERLLNSFDIRIQPVFNTRSGESCGDRRRWGYDLSEAAGLVALPDGRRLSDPELDAPDEDPRDLALTDASGSTVAASNESPKSLMSGSDPSGVHVGPSAEFQPVEPA